MPPGTNLAAQPYELPTDYRPAADLFKGRRLLISGASGEIGCCAAEAFAAAGASLTLLGRNRVRLERLGQRVAELGNEPLLVQMDYLRAGWDDYQALAGQIDQNHEALDGWLHVSAELGPLVTADHYPPERWAEVLHINLNAPFMLMQALMPVLRASGDAAVAMALGDVCWRGRAYWGAYAASNQGLKGLIEVLGGELADSATVRINGVVPGAVNSHIYRSAYPGLSADTLADISTILPGLFYLLGPDSRGSCGRIFVNPI
jgi:NAD(P)-dependent dehydrogenase (short-subunit alcohol dehydrogenase family)